MLSFSAALKRSACPMWTSSLRLLLVEFWRSTSESVGEFRSSICWRQPFAFSLQTLRCFGGWRSIAKRVALSGRLRLGWHIRSAGDESGLDSDQLCPYRKRSQATRWFHWNGGNCWRDRSEVFCPTLLSRSLGAEGLFLVMGGSIAISTGLVFAIVHGMNALTPALRNAPAIKSQRSATLA